MHVYHDTRPAPATQPRAKQLNKLKEDRRCQYGGVREHDYGREWNGDERAEQCVFDDSIGFPEIYSHFRDANPTATDEQAVQCCFEMDHIDPSTKVKDPSSLSPKGLQEELSNLRSLCYACHRWSTFGPSVDNVSSINDYAAVYHMLVQAFGDPLKDPEVAQDFLASGKHWRKFCVIRHWRNKQRDAAGREHDSKVMEDDGQAYPLSYLLSLRFRN